MIQRKLKVLIADDNRDLCENIAEIFDDLGCDVDQANDGNEAMDVALSKSFDLLVLDIRMPYRTGVEVFQRVQRHDPKIKAIFMTGYSSDDLLRTAADLGIGRVIEKPPESSEFRKVFESFLNSSA